MLSFYLAGIKKLLSLGKKIFLVIAVYFIVISLFAYFINKDKPTVTYDPVKKNREEMYKVINDPKLNKTKEGKMSILFYRTAMCGMIGEGCSEKPSDGEKNYHNSLFGFVGNLLIIPYINPPASGLYWAYSGLQNAGLIPKSYAATQGIGMASIRAFAPLWDAFRKLAYLVLVLIIITIGFMIMFRMKLNPQTVISVESALPKIVITLLLITFSYAIVGFSIDAMYLVTILIVDIVGKAAGFTNISHIQSNIITSNIINFEILDVWGGWGQTFWSYLDGLYAIIDIFPLLVRGTINTILSAVALLLAMRFSQTVTDFITKLFGDLTGQGGILVIQGHVGVAKIIAAILGIIIGAILGNFFLWLLLAVIVLLGLLFLLFRIVFVLLSSLIQLILYIILAPLYILLEAVPGRSAFSGWFKNIIANLAVFPAVVFLLLLTAIITKAYDYGQWSVYDPRGPAQIPTPPLLGFLNGSVIAPLINAVLLMTIPDLAKLLKQTIIGKEGFQLPVGPGALFGAAGAVGGTALGLSQQLYYLQLGYHALFGKGKGDQREPGGAESLLGSVGSAIGRAIKGPKG